jgi:hypothetical protein
MGGCFTSILFLVAFFFVGITLIRWFEQTSEAVDARQWGRVMMLVIFPFAVWLFPSRISAGRPSPFPLHEPVRGFGSMPLTPPTTSRKAQSAPAEAPKPPPPPPAKRKSAIDPEQVAKLKEKMRQQGMLPPDDQ